MAAWIQFNRGDTKYPVVVLKVEDLGWKSEISSVLFNSQLKKHYSTEGLV